MPDSGAWLDKAALILRADADSRVGLGHIMRCLALAQAWRKAGGSAIFLTRCKSSLILKKIKKEGFELESLERVHPNATDSKSLISLCRRIEAKGLRAVAVVDGYHFDSAYQKEVFKAGFRFLCVDDYGHSERYWADWVLNQNASASSRIYAGKAPRSQLLLGPEYALLRREFIDCHNFERRIPQRAQKLLVTLGGADPVNATTKVLESLSQLRIKSLEVRILIGSENPRRNELKSKIKPLHFAKGPHIRLISKTDNMVGMMAWADLAVSAGGSTCWEMAALGLPNAIITIADNQIKNSQALARRGVSVNLGWHEEVKIDRISQVLKDLITDKALRTSMSQRGRMMVDGSGASKVCSLLSESFS